MPIVTRFLSGTALAQVPIAANITIINTATAGNVIVTNALGEIATLPPNTSINVYTGSEAFDNLDVEGVGGGTYLVIYF